jgi:hypothetical protein
VEGVTRSACLLSCFALPFRPDQLPKVKGRVVLRFEKGGEGRYSLGRHLTTTKGEGLGAKVPFFVLGFAQAKKGQKMCCSGARTYNDKQKRLERKRFDEGLRDGGQTCCTSNCIVIPAGSYKL